MWTSEFGRTPYGQSGNGRDHNPWGYTSWMAGGGIKPGTYGGTDDIGLRAQTGIVDTYDLQATILNRLGLDNRKVTFAVPRAARSVRRRCSATSSRTSWPDAPGGARASRACAPRASDMNLTPEDSPSSSSPSSHWPAPRSSASFDIDGDLMRDIDDTAKSLDSDVTTEGRQGRDRRCARSLVDTFARIESHYGEKPETADAAGFAHRTQASSRNRR